MFNSYLKFRLKLYLFLTKEIFIAIILIVVVVIIIIIIIVVVIILIVVIIIVIVIIIFIVVIIIIFIIVVVIIIDAASNFLLDLKLFPVNYSWPFCFLNSSFNFKYNFKYFISNFKVWKIRIFYGRNSFTFMRIIVCFINCLLSYYPIFLENKKIPEKSQNCLRWCCRIR